MSVTVVSTTVPDNAGSAPKRFNNNGMLAPEMAATNKLITIAAAITKPSCMLWNHKPATVAMMIQLMAVIVRLLPAAMVS